MSDLSIEEMAAELVQAGMLLSDEFGEWMQMIGGIHRHAHNFACRAFRDAWEQEVRDCHLILKEDYRFVTYTESKPVTKTVLMHVDDMEACDE